MLTRRNAASSPLTDCFPATLIFFFLARKFVPAVAPVGIWQRGVRWTSFAMGLMHNYVIQCMRVRLGGIAKQVPRVCVPFLRTGYKYTSLIRKLSGINGG